MGPSSKAHFLKLNSAFSMIKSWSNANDLYDRVKLYKLFKFFGKTEHTKLLLTRQIDWTSNRTLKTHLQLKIPPFLKNLRTRNMNYTYKSLSKINSLKKNFLSSPIQKWITHYFMTSTYDQSSCNLNIQSTVLKLLYIYWK